MNFYGVLDKVKKQSAVQTLNRGFDFSVQEKAYIVQDQEEYETLQRYFEFYIGLDDTAKIREIQANQPTKVVLFYNNNIFKKNF